jgi:CRP-like cAMP-binding protein
MGTMLFHKGELIIKAGYQGNIPVYIIASGSAKILHQYSYQETTFEEGDLIGENIILNTDTSPVEIIAQQDVWVYAIEKEMLYRVISYYPQTGHVYAQIASRMLPDESLSSEALLITT